MGPLEALETLDGKSQHRVSGSRALVHKGVVQEGDCCHIHLYGPRVHGLAEVDFNRVIVSFVPGTGISLKPWQKPW